MPSMQMTPYNPRGRRGIPWGQVAAQAALYGGRAAFNYLTRPQQQPIYVPVPQAQPLPVTQYARGRAGRGRRPRGRRGGRRGRGAGGLTRAMAGMSLSGGSVATFVDAECVGTTKGGEVNVVSFNPGTCELPRLKYEAAKWTRFKINYINIAYITTSSITDSGSFYLGIVNGVATKEQFAADASTKILAMRPSFAVPTWKNDSVSLGANIMPVKTMPVETDSTKLTIDNVPFTCVETTSKGADNKGIVKWSYSITFSHPHA
nr:hypothetical protein [Leuven wasp-associated virus 4]